MIEYYTVVNVAHTFSVVVDNDYGFCRPVQFRTFQNGLQMRIHDHQQRVFINAFFRFVRFDKIIPAASAAEFLNEVCREALALVDHRGGGFAAQLRKAQHTDGGTQSVQIGRAVAHDQHAFALCHQILDGGGDDAAFHLAALFHTAGHTAVELKALGTFDSGLVAAASQRHIQRLHSHGFALAQCGGQPPYADGERHGARLFADLAHFIQDGKAVFNDLLHMALFHHSDIPRGADAPQKACGGPDELFQRQIDLTRYAGAVALFHFLEDLVVGIHGNEHHRGACGKILSRLPLECGIVDKIGHEQAVARLHAAAVHGITLAAELDVLARLFFRQRRHERRDHLRHGQQAHVPAAHYIVTERIVVPRHAAACEDNDRDAHGGKTSLRRAGCIRSAVQQTRQPVPEPADVQPDHDAHNEQHAHDKNKVSGLHQRQRNAQRDAGRGQDDDGRVKRRKSFFHAVPPLFSGAAAAARLIPPSKWAESWGCALSCGTKRRTPSRGYAF